MCQAALRCLSFQYSFYSRILLFYEFTLVLPVVWYHHCILQLFLFFLFAVAEMLYGILVAINSQHVFLHL
jgi:hypothetical protein